MSPALLCADDTKPASDRKVREIFVPFEDLNVLLEGPDQRVLLTREEYHELLSQSKLAPPEERAPRSRVLLSAEYDATVSEGRAAIRGTIAIDVLTDELLAIPLGIRGVTIRSATLDDRPAAVGRDNQGNPTLFVRGKGPHQLVLEMLAPVEMTAAQQQLRFRLPLPASTQWRLTVPGNVEIKSGAEVLRREVDADGNMTRFELVPQRAETTLVMTLNNRILLQQRVVLARSVVIEELTQAYDKLHATISLAIPHGAADRFRFSLPAGFEITDVGTPLLARWAVETSDDGERILDVLLREPARGSVVMQLVAVNHAPSLAPWTMPQIRLLDADSQVAILGLLAEARLAAESLTPTGLIPIDATVLSSALPASVLDPEPGAPRLRPIAAYFAPQPDFALQAAFRRLESRLESTSNLLFTVGDQRILLRGGFAFKPSVEPLFMAEILIPAQWNVTSVTQSDGGLLPFELFPSAGGSTRLQVRLPAGAPPDQFFNLYVYANHTPAGWLDEWSEIALALPGFVVPGATRTVGAVAVQVLDDLQVRPDQLTNLTPLDEQEKVNFGLEGVTTSQAYRFETQPYSATLTVQRPLPRVTARTFNFLRLDPVGVVAHYELNYQIDRARARRLMLRLPATTPEALSIRGLDVAVKEFRSEMVDGQRQWTVELAEPRAGSVRLAVDFQQKIPNISADPQEIGLPIVVAQGVVYQSGLVAVEGNLEFDVQLTTDARKVDVGELVEAEYQVGKRLLGAYGFVADPAAVIASVVRRPEFGLPPALVQRAELVTLLSAHGMSQTAARFQLRTKGPFIEMGLPAGSTLWSVTVGDRPAAPQRDQDRLLISLGSAGSDRLHDLQLVYDTPVDSWTRWGEVELDAPQLMLRDETGANRAEVPLADLQWHLLLPEGQRIVRSGGTVFLEGRLSVRSTVGAILDAARAPFAALTPTRVASRAGRYRNQFSDGSVSTTLEYARPEAIPSDARLPAPTMPLPRAADEPLMDKAFFAEPQPPLSTPIPPQAAAPSPVAGLAGAQPVVPAEPVAPPTAGRPAAVSKGKGVFWALEGTRSLPVELARVGDQVTFRSLGVAPRLQVSLARRWSLDFLAVALAIAVGVAGLARTRQPLARKAKFIILGGALLVAAPLVLGILFDMELSELFVPALAVLCALVPWYFVVGVARGLASAARRGSARTPQQAVATAILLGLSVTSTVSAQQPAGVDDLRDLLAPRTPVTVPADAIVIPYDAEDPAGPQSATKVFVPYSEYVRLWNRAHPDRPLTAKPPVAPWAIGGTLYSTTLDEGDSLAVTGRMEVEVYAEGMQQIPLPLTDAVLTRVSVDGQPAKLQVIQPVPAGEIAAAPPANAPAQQAMQPPPVPAIPVVLVEGTGRKIVEFELQFRVTRSGGWRRVAGRVPVTGAAALDLLVPKAGTEVRVRCEQATSTSNEFGTQQDRQTLQTAIETAGTFDVQWRPKLAQAQIDQSLTAQSTAVLDIQEDAVRLVWKSELSFPRGLRESFSFHIPRDMLLERVVGKNVRGWKSTPDDVAVRVDVALLNSVTGSESLTLVMSRRAAVGQAELEKFPAPVVSVLDAALHRGTLMIRRSPLLNIRIDEASGLNRADASDEEIAAVLANLTEENPLGIRPFQTYRFASTPYAMRITAAAQVAKTTVEVQSLLRIADRESPYEARLLFTVENRPRYLVRCRLPAGLQLDTVVGPERLEWTTVSGPEGDVLSVFLPDGQQQFSLVARGRLARPAGNAFPAPRLEVLDVERQSGQLVIQADPAEQVRADELQGCEIVFLEQVSGWLNDEQRRLARIALAYRTSDFAARLQMSPRTPKVESFTITNSRITPFAVEDTVYLQFDIQEAGIRTVQFQLPADMRDAKVTVPLLRQQTIEPVPGQPERVRFTLELQDEVTGQLIVLVERDRALAGNLYEAPIPIVDTGTAPQRFVVLESAGRDEVVVAAANQLTELNRQQSQWTRLAETLGDRITQAYLVRENATQPRLAIQLRQRAIVETAGARIGLAVTTLIVDGSGAYRGIQQYHVDNKTEQYLEVELPEGAELWTARVAGESAKPVAAAAGGGPRNLRVPLIKTATGDLDYIVELKYGGQIAMPRGLGQMAFPLIHTVNINVEMSQVRLRLPETAKWLDFGGSMRQVRDEQSLLAGFFAYKSKQVAQLLDVVRGDGDDFSKVRAYGNLKQLGLALHNYHETFRARPQNEELQREFNSNRAIVLQANQWMDQNAVVPQQQVAEDNRTLLMLKCASQPVSRSKNVVARLADNFDADSAAAPPSSSGENPFNLKWLRGNSLQTFGDESEQSKKELERLDLFSTKGQPAKPVEAKEAANRAANTLGRKVAQDAQAADDGLVQSREMSGGMQPNAGQAATDDRVEQLQRYQQRLEQQEGGATGPGGGGFGGGQQAAGERTQLARASEVASAGLASLDIEFPVRGREFLFVTPRGEIEIKARLVDSDLGNRSLALGSLLVGLAALAFIVRLRKRL